MLFRLKEIFREKGFRGAIRYIFAKLTGRQAIEDSLNTAFYLLNKYMDIGKFPKAEGNLRKLQLCDASLLKLFDAVCKKNGLKYWLDWGTLLGAVRHKGFIPWDDDMDVSMPREDFERAMEILPGEMKEYGVDISEMPGQPYAGFGFSYRHKESGVWLDVFPADTSERTVSTEEEKARFTKDKKKYRSYYHRNKERLSKEEIFRFKESILGKKGDGILYNGAEFEPKAYIHDLKDIYPLGTVDFEGHLFPAPKDTDRYLRVQYGNTYMQFPRSGIESHGDSEDRISDWHLRYGIDMDDIRKEIEDITEKYTKA